MMSQNIEVAYECDVGVSGINKSAPLVIIKQSPYFFWGVSHFIYSYYGIYGISYVIIVRLIVGKCQKIPKKSWKINRLASNNIAIALSQQFAVKTLGTITFSSKNTHNHTNTKEQHQQHQQQHHHQQF
jgi:hypothetical protein